MPEIKETLQDFNPWWKVEYKTIFKEREIYSKIQKFLQLPQIIAFTGLRRVGKTTLMLKIVEDNIRNGFDPKNIIYFSFDEFKDIEIRNLISGYEELMERYFNKGRHILLLDEIQKLDGWENQLKAIYDLFGKTAKIIISGSESLFIKKKSKETLAGRIFEFKLEPLSFREFISFKNLTFEPLGLYKNELIKLLDEYVLTLGFPELVNVKDKEIIAKYIKESIIEKVIFRDMQYLFKIRDISKLESLLNILVEEPGQLIELSELSKGLGVSRQTLSTYLNYLEKSFLVKKLYNYSKSRRKVERKLRKYYPAVISPSLLFKDDEFSKSKVFEWLMVVQLNAEFFWRDPFKNEVDIVLANNKTLPIEIKYGKIDTHGLLAFMKKFNVRGGIVITKNKDGKHKFNGKTVSLIPAFKFLLKWEGENRKV